MGEKITIRDVAKLANVSVATVSRVINKTVPVSPQIEKRVNQAIQELNYLPSSIASSLKADRTHMIGYVTATIENPVFVTLMSEIEKILWQHNYSIMLCSTNNDIKKETSILKLLLSKKVDGLILNSCGSDEEYISKISHKIPMVLSGKNINHPDFIGDFVEVENFSSAYILTTHLISYGHRKIGIINGPLALNAGFERFNGFKAAMAAINISVDSKYPYVYNADFSREQGYKGIRELLELPERPTAVFVANMEMMQGVLKYCIEHHLNIPDDISLVTIGNREDLDFLYVRPTMMEMDLINIAKKMADVLLERINTKSAIARREYRFPSIIVFGNSVKTLT